MSNNNEGERGKWFGRILVGCYTSAMICILVIAFGLHWMAGLGVLAVIFMVFASAAKELYLKAKK